MTAPQESAFRLAQLFVDADQADSDLRDETFVQHAFELYEESNRISPYPRSKLSREALQKLCDEERELRAEGDLEGPMPEEDEAPPDHDGEPTG